MRNVVLALTWESWRLSRRWYLWVLPLAFAFDYMIMRQARSIAFRDPRGFAEPEVIAVLLAPSAFMMNFMLAMFATLLAVSLGNKSGFPLSFEFRLPVRTTLLVAVPMATLATLCASLFVLPMLAVRLVYGIPVPLLAPAALIATLVVILVACGWSTASSGSRTVAMVLGILVAGQIFGVINPVDMSNPRYVPGQIPEFNRNLIALSSTEYAWLAFMGLGLYALATASIRKQRYGEAPMLQLPGVKQAQPRNKNAPLRDLLSRVSDRLLPSCPTSSPWLAELWLEARRQVLPIVLLSVLIAACVPLLYLMGIAPGAPFDDADYLFPGAVFFVGIGMAIFNRRQSTAGYMSAFEGTRGMSTLALAAIQMLAVAGATLCGIALVLVSVHFASALIEVPGNLALRIEDALITAKERSALSLFTAAIVELGQFVAWVMLLACVHTWSVVWGRWVPYGAGILTVYGAAQALRMRLASERQDDATLEEIGTYLWVVAGVIGVLTLLALARTLYTRVLSLRVSAAALAVWGVFIACSVHVILQEAPAFSALKPAMQAFRAALLVTPLTLFILLLWSYDRLRHR